MYLLSLINGLLIRKQKIVLFLIDYAFLIFSLLISNFIFEYKHYGILPNESLNLYSLFLIFLICFLFSVFYISNLYHLPSRIKDLSLKFSALLIANIVLFSGIAIFCYLTKFSLGRDVLGLAYFLYFIFFLLNRLILIQIFSAKYLALVKPIKCLFLNHGPLISLLKEENTYNKQYEFLIFEPSDHLLKDFIKEENIEIIIIDSYSEENIKDLLVYELIELKFHGIKVIEAANFFEQINFRVPILNLPGHWFLNSQVFNDITNQALLRAKRIFDILSALILGILTLPIMLCVVLIMKIMSKDSIFYTQARVGLNGKVFTIYKLRSMFANSEKDGIQWTVSRDPRITPIGKILRATRLDELPQLINILKGDMSLIGPRPERPEFTSQLQKEIPFYDLRHSVRPGLSGWAQVNEPLATPSDSLKKLEYDLFYIRHLSLWLEFEIILRTIQVVLMRKGN